MSVTRLLRRAPLLAALSSAVTACGSRSHLAESVAAGGSATAGGGGSSGSASGSGGIDACSSLTRVGGIVQVEQPSDVIDDGPLLAAASDDGSRLTAAFIRESPAGSGFGQLTDATFSPWQAWPTGSVGPTHAPFDGSEFWTPFAISPTAGDRLGLLVVHQVGTAPVIGTVSFAPSVDPTSADAGPIVTVSNSSTPVFAAPGPPGYHLVGDFDGKALIGHVVHESGAGLSVIDVPLTCGQWWQMSDAVWGSGGWLVAVRDTPPADCSPATVGGTSIDIVRVTLDGNLSYVTSIDDAGAPGSIAVAPHPGGAFVVWLSVLSIDLAQLRFARIDAESGSVVGPNEIIEPSYYPEGGFDATALGNDLAVVWGNAPADASPELRVSVFSEDGALVAHAGVDAGIEYGSSGPVGVAASPLGTSLVAAWHEATSSGGARVLLARFDCSGAP